jgi:hypothetical protein
MDTHSILEVKMKTSESVAEIASALSAFQSAVEDVQKDAEGHNYRYATLPAILQLIRPLMGAHGLSLTQFPIDNAGHVGVVSRLMHSSGEWMEDTFLLPVVESRGMSSSQAAGSVITYVRKYAAAAILGISQEDSDGEVEEPVIKPATEEQYTRINEHVKNGDVGKRRLSWLQIEKNWNSLTHVQAETILNEIQRSMTK